MIYFHNPNDTSTKLNQIYVFSNYLISKFKPGFKGKLRIKKRRCLSTVDFLSDYYSIVKQLIAIQKK